MQYYNLDVIHSLLKMYASQPIYDNDNPKF